MDIEKLKALKTAVEIGSITQAAEHMGYSQPGLTGMLKRLEQEIGYPLLRRGSGGVRLTDEGRALMPYIERILRESDTFEHAVRAPRSRMSCASGRIPAFPRTGCRRSSAASAGNIPACARTSPPSRRRTAPSSR